MTMYAKVQTGEKVVFLTRKVAAANQNALTAYDMPSPQWYDVKFLVERMFDLRGVVRDAIGKRKAAERMRLRVAGMSVRQIVIAEIHGHNMDIALAWHDYREAVTAYHHMWDVYQKNLKKF